MAVISEQQYAKAILWHNSLSEEQCIKRWDELFVEQRFVFLELLSFGRDGATPQQTDAMLNYLSVLQHLACDREPRVAIPIEEAEFTNAVERAFQYFRTVQSDDPEEENRMHRILFQSIKESGEPTIWAGMHMVLQQATVLSSPLAQGMIVTLFALADCYSRRFASLTDR